jgi:DNA-binding transcriptional MerR regulator
MSVPDVTNGGGRGEYRIDELAQRAGTTVRNVRAYQDRGLLAPPRRVGRVGIYDDRHLSRLRLINQLLERGYSLANIAELVTAWEQGHNLGELIGLEAAHTGPWSDEVPITVDAADLAAVFGEDDRALDTAIRLGIIEPDGERFRINSPRLFQAGAELVAAGIPLDAVMANARALQRDMDRVAARFVQLVTTHVFDPLGDRLPKEEVPRLAEVVQRLRPLAQMAVDAELARAMERQVRAQLGDRLGRLLDHLRSQSEAS